MGGCVHTIAVKRSKRVCSSKAGINEGLKEQSNFTKFHRGQGGPGGESVWLILLCPVHSRPKKSAVWDFPETVAFFFPVQEGFASGSRYRIRDSRPSTWSASWYGYLLANTHWYHAPVSPQPPLRKTLKLAFKWAVVFIQ